MGGLCPKHGDSRAASWDLKRVDVLQDNWSIVHVAGDFSVYTVCDGHGMSGRLSAAAQGFTCFTSPSSGIYLVMWV